MSSLTYAQLFARASRCAAALRRCGFVSGDRIALLAKNDVSFSELACAASMIGVVLVPLNFRLAQPEIDFIVEDAEARLLFATSQFLETARATRSTVEDCMDVIEITGDGNYAGWRGDTALDEAPADNGEAVLFQMYTSGTTGQPKVALLTHANIVALCRNGVQFLGPFSQNSRNMVCMPLFHVAGNAWLFFGLAAGCSNKLVVDIDPATVLDIITKNHISSTLMVPAVIQMLVLAAEDSGQAISGLKTIAFGASPMPAELLRRAQRVFVDADFIHVYGMTETTCMFCALDAEELRAGRRLESCGKPFPDADMKIMDAQGVQVATGVIGEVICRAPQMTSGYWRRPEATSNAIQNGWYHTGDAGYVDDEEFLYIRDRIKDMLISGGENVYPAEVENAILAHTAVADVAVIGVPDA
ncbi:MAG: AMP-binding protein, partial [Pseudomonadota bacterium]